MLIASLGAPRAVMAAGFEKSIPWGARSAGMGGIATPYIQGSQALFFNPAGLVSDKPGQDVSLNLSPTWAQFEGPFNTLQGGIKDEKGKRTFLVPFGLIYGGTIDDRFGFGIGVYASGGSNAVFEGLDFAPRPIRPTVKTEIQLIEIAAGVGYRVTPELKLGAAYRVSLVQANFGALIYPASPAGAIINATAEDLKDTNAAGFALGAQYKAGDTTLLGLKFRSEIRLKPKGTLNAVVDSGTLTTLPSADVTVTTVFPMQISFGAQQELVPGAWRLLGEYVFTQYSKVDTIGIDATLAQIGRTPDIVANWKDQHNIRFGVEYLETAWPVRAGYVWTSRVVDPAYARPTFTPPGDAHTITLGTGHAFAVAEMPLQFDIAGEYTRTQGDGDANSPQTLASPPGTYKATAYAIHAGLSYAF